MPLARGVKDKSSTIKVLSWNINGSGRAGMADVRKNILKSAISRINPDVMLLQETIKSVDGFFEDAGIPKKDYNYEEAEDKTETRVIYKNNAFEKVDPSPVNLNTVLAEMVPEDETKFLRRGKVPERQMIKNGICIAHLRHISTKREIIFVSYRNIRNHGGNIATKVCEIIARLHKSSECYVIAGVDFNCDSFDSTSVEVPSYTTTSRRENKEKTDFYILSKSTENWKVKEVKAFDLSSLDKTLESEGFKRDQLNKALDHDPLLLSLSEVKTEEGKEKEVKRKRKGRKRGRSKRKRRRRRRKRRRRRRRRRR